MAMMRTPSISPGRPVERHAGGGRHAEIDDHDAVVIGGLRRLDHGGPNVLVELPAHQALRVERHVADGPPGAAEMRGEGEAVDATGRAREERRGAPHPQPDPQAAEARAHRSRLVVRAARVVGEQLADRLAPAGRARRLEHRPAAAVAGAGLGGSCRPRRSGPVKTTAMVLIRGPLPGRCGRLHECQPDLTCWTVRHRLQSHDRPVTDAQPSGA